MSDEAERRELREALAGRASRRRLVEVSRLADALAATLRRALSGSSPGAALGFCLDLPWDRRLSVEAALFFWEHGAGLSLDSEGRGVWIETEDENGLPRFFPFAPAPPCPSRNPTTGVTCTRDRHHFGDHVGPWRDSRRRIWSDPPPGESLAGRDYPAAAPLDPRDGGV